MSFKRIIVATVFALTLGTQLFSASWVKVANNPEEGWKLLVDGEAVSIHGIVWSFTPIGENYSYNLWDQPQQFIQNTIDRDAELLQAMGVNVIRSFSDIPPEWVTYLYQRYNIYTVINNLFGRYGLTVDGRWHAGTNYSDVRTREVILEELRESIEQYKDVPGVLFYLLGNENNYGLEWDSDNIENLPIGQRMETRAGYLYSLFEEGIQIVKEIDPTKPVGIVNGDIQYLNIIQALIPSLDILGVNTYRGDAAYDLFYESVQQTLNVPIVFTELGADAFNIRTGEEDQYSQASIIKSQWQEIYEQSYNKGNFQNCLGAFVFEWVDEWWKHGMTEDLDLHDKTGTWANGAYAFDNVSGENNMNEEWFGIVAQSTRKKDGINLKVPRAAYYVLQEIWNLDQIESTKEDVQNHFASIDVKDFLPQGETAMILNRLKEKTAFNFRGSASVLGNAYFSDVDLEMSGKEGISTSFGEWAYAGVDVAPFENLEAGVTLRVQGHVPDTVFERDVYSKYGSLILDAGVLEDPSNPANYPPLEDQEITFEDKVQIYDAYINYRNRFFDLNGYYHTGHTDWVSEGDFFNLLPESFDLVGMDIDNSNAPVGVEFVGKDFLEGLTVYGGPEIYWGADPQVMAKYYRQGEYFSWSALYDEAISLEDPEVAAGSYSRRASLYAGLDFYPWIHADLGVLWSGSEKLGELYDHVVRNSDGSYTVEPGQEISILDTFSGKIELASEAFLYTKLFGKYVYAGRVAESHPLISRNGSQLTDIGTGNRHEVEAGVQFTVGNLTAMPKFLWRKPISNALPLSEGLPRKALLDPFIVYNNREAIQAELTLTFDTAGDTYFFDWNNEDRENGIFAAYVSFLYTFYQGPTDATTYKTMYGDTVSFGFGLPEASNLWSLNSRFVINPLPALKIAAGFNAGLGQSTGEDSRLVNYYGGYITTRYNRLMLDLSADFNSWGKENWYRQFNITYPIQWAVDLAYGFDTPSFLDKSNRIGIRWSGRTYDDNAPLDEYALGEKWRMELATYLSLSW